MLFPFAPAKNRTSGPKGHKDDKVYAGDKSPAYPEDEFFRSCFTRKGFIPPSTFWMTRRGTQVSILA
jgi:hypothetical protein